MQVVATILNLSPKHAAELEEPCPVCASPAVLADATYCEASGLLDYRLACSSENCDVQILGIV